jgi:hypothetical protein
MLNRIFPPQFDNNYRGHKLALWLFIPIVLMKVGISLSSIFDGYNTVRSADGIPLDTFTSGGAEAVVSITALLGLSHFLLASLCVLALIRYRAMIPLMYVLLLVEYFAKKWILLVHPIVRTGTSPSTYVNLVLIALLIVGLALSLWNRGNRLENYEGEIAK